MSYLLEALQKSQQQREHLGPNLPATAVQVEVPDEPRRSPWLAVAVAALLLNALVMTYLFLRPEPVNTATPAAVTDADSSIAARPPTAENLSIAAPADIGLSMREVSVAPAAMAPIYATTPAATSTNYSPIEALYEQRAPLPNAQSIHAYTHDEPALPIATSEGLTMANPTTVNASAEVSNHVSNHVSNNVSADGEAAVVRTDVIHIERLPAALRSQMPALEMQSHIFSTRANDSFVLFNGASVAVGQSLANGLRLNEISADGVILVFQGQKIFMPALTSFKP